METINGVSFEEFAAASANLANGMPEQQVLDILGLEAPVWAQTLEQWTQRLQDMMLEDMEAAARYGAIFANPRVGRFANVAGGFDPAGSDDWEEAVPDIDTYARVFWHQVVAAEHGVDAHAVLSEYGLTLAGWSAAAMHYQHEVLANADSDSEAYQTYLEASEEWEQHYREHYADLRPGSSDDIEF